MALSDAKLRALTKGHDSKTPKKVSDRDGLAALVRNSGRVSFIYRYRFNGKAQTATLGVYPDMSLSEARAKLSECRAWLNNGRNPRTEIKLAKTAFRQAVTVQDALEYWIDGYARKHRSNADKHQAQFQKHIYPYIGSLPVEEIETRHWVKTFDDICNGTHFRAAPVAAGYILQNCKQALIYCRKRHFCTSHALDDLQVTDIGERQSKKERYLTIEEAKTVWQWTDDHKGNWYYRQLIKLLMAFGARTQEVRLSKCNEWDLDKMLWTCPKAHSKNGAEIVRPIPEFFREYIASLIQQSKNEFLLGEFKQAPAVSAWAAILPKRLNQEPWRLHDLRRTISSHLNDAGIEPHIIEAILGHSIRGVAGVYNRAQYLEQKRKALDLWLAKLNETEHHSNVRAIR
ncbi:site-specific integrase [Vibrio parahaemolyticus]|jgi:integrase|uniref:tyrosine-type recombinase/integrase n=1 Tax=Vibrio parahaemolyticus TaxID=670 RepID=UPI00193F789A|nr:site-specific integrase [Vibrio parahaemolyticus]MBM4918227.1 site-specific integrase [Vibrio parahaemolyticus]MCG0014433.1 site-specific integrase [Vibrio parahaemolyticus]MDF4891239.1 site-specific integrase [Vibrio parahaemolyticus]MDL2000140.1 site-specific integrase [Vibrio parahaemolyticus]HCE4735054.1 site-specific integrase [Vibrio parahaemolyticus]